MDKNLAKLDMTACQFIFTWGNIVQCGAQLTERPNKYPCTNFYMQMKKLPADKTPLMMLRHRATP